jgi:hypothetical protein
MGTNRYKLTLYTNGYLMAKLTVTRTNIIGNAAVPGEVLFTQFKTRPVDNNQLKIQIRNNQMPTRSPDDVVPVESALFSITNCQVGAALASYIPEIVDKNASVNDRRIGSIAVQVSSGKWWTARELYNSREVPVKSHRNVVLIVLLISSLFPIILLIRMAMLGKNRTTVK